jgi:hypothetical protein
VTQMLWREFTKADDVARASARFESEVHEELVQRRLAEGYGEDEAGAVRRVFKADDFNDTFRRLLQLRIEMRMIKRLGLHAYEREIVAERIKEVLGAKPTAMKSVAVSQPTDKLQIGGAESQQVRDLKSRAKSSRWTKSRK